MSEFSAPQTGGTVALPSVAVPTQQSERTTALPSSLASAANGGHTTALPSGPRKTRVLSIGLHAEAAPEAAKQPRADRRAARVPGTRAAHQLTRDQPRASPRSAKSRSQIRA